MAFIALIMSASIDNELTSAANFFDQGGSEIKQHRTQQTNKQTNHCDARVSNHTDVSTHRTQGQPCSRRDHTRQTQHQGIADPCPGPYEAPTVCLDNKYHDDHCPGRDSKQIKKGHRGWMQRQFINTQQYKKTMQQRQADKQKNNR